ncbi:hypothetical protein AMTR_s00072p00039120 [Amborella trichopoda]|uniref:Uncharacterized protein n=1 Tax=Amborella trichopoda TaxID=13333 RepID=W1NS04_AMBTC|nr:hypothetical protein AMTR_s00072p00039120 [Amborella trichopoda]
MTSILPPEMLLREIGHFHVLVIHSRKVLRSASCVENERTIALLSISFPGCKHGSDASMTKVSIGNTSCLRTFGNPATLAKDLSSEQWTVLEHSHLVGE